MKSEKCKVKNGEAAEVGGIDFGGPGGLPDPGAADLWLWSRQVVRELRRDWTLEQIGPVVSIKEATEIIGCSRTRVKRLIVEGRLNVWKDEDSRRVWVDTAEACRSLQVTKGWVGTLAMRGVIERRAAIRRGRRVYLFDSVELERVAETRLSKTTYMHPRKNLRAWGSRRVMRELAPMDWWMTVREVAEFLGVSLVRVCGMCATGMLPCYQKEPGKPGSRILISNSAVALLSEREDYRAAHARWESGREGPAKHVPDWEDRRVNGYDPRTHTKATERDYGDAYTTRQVALMLNVGVSRVRLLRETGRLAGFRRPDQANHGRGRQWWFFKKEDVHALQADAGYCRNHRTWERRRDRVWRG